MNVNTILRDLKAERERIIKAIDALQALDGMPKAGHPGRPRKAQATAAPRRGGRRQMSAAARAKLSRLLKQRWAARKKAGKSRLGV